MGSVRRVGLVRREVRKVVNGVMVVEVADEEEEVIELDDVLW